jgi:hypothetical protein
MAILANQLTVSIGQGETRGQKVVEAKFRPVSGGMTAFAVIPVAALVAVILPVTGNTLLRRIQVNLVHMAIDAGGLHVGTGERKIVLIVIVFGLLPLGFFMAVATVLAQITFVLVVRLMTGETGHGRLTEHGIAGVTVLTNRVQMTILERKIRGVVIKGL